MMGMVARVANYNYGRGHNFEEGRGEGGAEAVHQARRATRRPRK